MEIMKISMESLGKSDRGDSWRAFISKMIHEVDVSGAALENFSAEITVRKHDTVSCGVFWSKPHRLGWGRERAAHAGASGYLVSWQLEGEAHIEYGNRRVIQAAGAIAVADARRAMSVSFPGEVRRIVAKLPASLLEAKLPRLLTSHVEVFRPSGPFAPTLLSYFTELSREDAKVDPGDFEALLENVSNLLRITSGQSGQADCGAKELRRRALVQYLTRHACDPLIAIDAVAAHLHLSKRVVQQILQEMETTFTQFVTDERLRASAAKLSASKDVPVSQIAYLSGFNDLSHFNHLFKRRFGVTPSVHRRLSQEGASLAS